jgi:hypothetical protein
MPQTLTQQVFTPMILNLTLSLVSAFDHGTIIKWTSPSTTPASSLDVDEKRLLLRILWLWLSPMRFEGPPLRSGEWKKE